MRSRYSESTLRLEPKSWILAAGPGPSVTRLRDASYTVTACDFSAPKEKFAFPYRQVDLYQNFATRFESGAFDAVPIVEVIEHPWRTQGTPFGRLRYYSKREELFFLTNPKCLKMYSRLRFFFAGQMAMFTDSVYTDNGHITLLTAW
jgi:hypothetical protein